MDKQTCSKCVLHTRVPNVTIGEDGICSVCSNERNNERMNKIMVKYFSHKLKELIRSIKQHKWPYDALVLFSGGKDSTYLLKMAKEEYGLKVLAFSVIHPLVNKTAAKNAEDVANKLGVDLMKFYPVEDEYKNIIRYSLLKGYKAIEDECLGCYTCSFIFKNAALMTAMRMNIPVVFDGIDIDQSETIIFMEGREMKKNAAVGIKPFGKIHDVVMQGLGESYKGSIYDFDFELLKDYNFPSFISPFTFLNYDFRENNTLFKELNLESKDFRTVFTNCSAVPFFSYFSLKRYDCLTYIRHYASEIRKNYPFLLQSKIDNSIKPNALSKETIEALSEEYRNVIYYVANGNIDKSNITKANREEILNMASTHQSIYGKEVCEIFLEQALEINRYAHFFNINLMEIQQG